MGCIFELVLKDSNITERFNVTRESGSMHTTSNNHREAYGSVFVSDWEEDGMDGNFTFDVTGSVSVLTMAEFIARTGFDNQEGKHARSININRTCPLLLHTTMSIVRVFNARIKFIVPYVKL